MRQLRRNRGRSRFGDWESSQWFSTNNLAAGATNIYQIYALTPQVQQSNQIGVGSAILSELDIWCRITSTALLAAQLQLCAGLANDQWDANPALGAGPPVGAWSIRGDLTSPVGGNSSPTEDDWIWGPEPKVLMLPSNASQTAGVEIGWTIKIRKPITVHQGHRLCFTLSSAAASTAACVITFCERHKVRRIA